MNVVVVGGAKGIGKETALRLEDHNVTVIDRDPGSLQKLPERLEKIELDITDRNQVKKVFSDREVDVLVNCAGVQKQGAVEDAPVKEFEEHIETNFIGTVNTVKAALPGLKEKSGKIVNVSSIAGKVALPYLSGYSASKFAVEGFTDSLRRELEDVSVVLVEPGRVKTGFNQRGVDNLEKFVEYSEHSDEYREKLGTERKGLEPGKAGKKLAKIVEKGGKPRYTITREAWLLDKILLKLPDSLQDLIVEKV